MDTGKKLGFLTMCADRRFHEQAEKKFQELTGLHSEEYWIEAAAGGAPGIESTKTADYAYHHGARAMGWAAHGDTCGGFPDVGTEEMRKKLMESIKIRKERYPDAIHYFIFSTEEKTDGGQV